MLLQRRKAVICNLKNGPNVLGFFLSTFGNTFDCLTSIE